LAQEFVGEFAAMPEAPSLKDVGSAKLDWGNLRFDMTEVHGHFKATFKDGAWDAGEVVYSQFINMHVMSNVFHYGQSVFEGMKAFHCKDGRVRVFADFKNYERISSSLERVCLPTMSKELWQRGIDEAVKANLDFVPPYGSGASLYIRPFVMGSSGHLGVHPSEEATFIVAVSPVGAYFKTGSLPTIDGAIIEDFDRAAPRGTGHVKFAGNYAAGLKPQQSHKDKGFPIGLHLDPKENKYLEEFNTSNFAAITKDGRFYVTPDSSTILPSVTNWCLTHLVKEHGYTVQRRPIPIDELEEFAEVGAVGTAVVVTPIASLTRPSDGKKWEFGQPSVFQKLHDEILAIQKAEAPDRFAWCREIVCPA